MSAAISSTYFYTGLRDPVQRLQTELASLQQEISSGRKSDVGLDLGSRTGIVVGLRSELARTQAFAGANRSTTARLTATQTALGSIAAAAQTLVEQLSQSQGGDPQALRTAAASTLAQLSGTLNTSFAGGYLFSGINSAAKPIADYFVAPTSPAKTATDQSFLAAFGVAQGSTGAANISGAAMQSYLDTQFAVLFDPSNWKANWSNASDTPLKSRLDAATTIDSSVSANETAIRGVMQAIVMTSDLGVASLGKDAQAVVVSSARALLGQSLKLLTNVQARVGGAQVQTDSASSALTTQAGYLQGRIDDLESVDPAEASLRLTALSTQLQSAYALTSRISQLTLLKYI